ncbi:glycosyltransferase family 4 protein [Saccharolobus sp.]|uniref:glycosyltransferase family 4 protein n=1 Tax=Saccharolobus sp. TaxID=2100761 RepID=UPI003178720D
MIFSGRSNPDKVLVIIGLLYRSHPSKPGLDVAKILSHIFRKVEVLFLPVLTFDSLAQLMWCWIFREVLVLLKILKNRSEIKLIVIHQMVVISGCFIGKLLGAKVIIYVSGSIYEGFYQRGFAKIAAAASIILWKLQLRLADIILIPSNQIINLSKLTGYIYKVRVAPTRFIRINEENKYGVDEISKRENVVGYIGRFEIEKGVEMLPKVIHLTIKTRKISDLKWILVGDGSLRQKIENEIRRLNLLNFVQITGWVKNPEAYLTKMKLLLLPSKSEGIPNVILEAMACGTPVLSTPVGALPDIIRDGETGFLLKSNNPEHIANRIIELLSNTELLEKVSKNAYKYVRENFSYEKTLQAWQKIFQQLRQV